MGSADGDSALQGGVADPQRGQQPLVVVYELLQLPRPVPGPGLQHGEELLADGVDAVQDGLDDPGVRFKTSADSSYQVFGIPLYICIH